MLRLGTVPYLNARPLVDALGRDPDVALVEEVPSRLALALRRAELDAALVSAVELFRGAPLGWLAGPAITSDGPVHSILLFRRVPLRDVRSVALDTSSLSAAAMTRVLLHDVAGVPTPRLVAAPPDLPLHAIEADAVLRIGDPALLTDRGDRAVDDLGALWSAHTGLPFVYALWLVPASGAADGLAERLVAACEAGLARRAELAARHAPTRGLDPERCLAYLTDAIGYTLGAREQAGLEAFGRRAHALGLVDRAVLPPPVAPATRPARA